MEADTEAGATVYPAPTRSKPWGREVVFAAVPRRYVGKVLHVDAGQSLSCQYHRRKEETISLVHGEVLVEYGPDADNLTRARFAPGDTIYLPAGTVHRLEAVTDSIVVECSTALPGWDEDVVRLSDSYGRAGTSEP